MQVVRIVNIRLISPLTTIKLENIVRNMTLGYGRVPRQHQTTIKSMTMTLKYGHVRKDAKIQNQKYEIY